MLVYGSAPSRAVDNAISGIRGTIRVVTDCVILKHPNWIGFRAFPSCLTSYFGARSTIRNRMCGHSKEFLARLSQSPMQVSEEVKAIDWIGLLETRATLQILMVIRTNYLRVPLPAQNWLVRIVTSDVSKWSTAHTFLSKIALQGKHWSEDNRLKRRRCNPFMSSYAMKPGDAYA